MEYMDFKHKDCPNCYLKGGPRHRYRFHEEPADPDSYDSLVELIYMADFCDVAKEKVDRAVRCLMDIPVDPEEWYHEYLDIECPDHRERPEVKVRASLPYPHLREFGKTIYSVEELREAVDDIIVEWLKESTKPEW